MARQPFHQGPAGVQGDSQIDVRFKNLEKGKIAVAICAFEDVVEVANRLVIMQDHAEAEGGCHRRALPYGL